MAEQKRRHTCPQCGQPIQRIHRWPLDRIASLVVPLRRYGCRQCGWSGLRADPYARRLPQLQIKNVVQIVLIVLALLFIVAITVYLTMNFG